MILIKARFEVFEMLSDARKYLSFMQMRRARVRRHERNSRLNDRQTRLNCEIFIHSQSPNFRDSTALPIFIAILFIHLCRKHESTTAAAKVFSLSLKNMQEMTILMKLSRPTEDLPS